MDFLFRIKSFLFRIELTNYHLYMPYFRRGLKGIIKHILIHAFTWLLVLSMGMVITNKVVFFHVHKLADGKIVTHAHPFNKSNDAAPFKKHQHTKAELLFYCHIDTLFISFFTAYFFYTFYRRVEVSKIIVERYIPLIIFLPDGRAPPRV